MTVEKKEGRSMAQMETCAGYSPPGRGHPARHSQCPAPQEPRNEPSSSRSGDSSPHRSPLPAASFLRDGEPLLGHIIFLLITKLIFSAWASERF